MSWIVAERVDGVRFLFPESQVRCISHCVKGEEKVTILMTSVTDSGFAAASMGCAWVHCVEKLSAALLGVANGIKRPDSISMIDNR